MVKNPFIWAEGQRVILTNNQARDIKKFYSKIAKEMDSTVEKMKNRDTPYAIEKRIYLTNVSNELKQKINDVDKKTEKTINTNVETMVGKVLQNNEVYLKGIGFKDFIQNPQLKVDMATRVVSGQLYQNKWSLSSAIWGDNQKKMNEINMIISRGILKNKTTYQIAKELQRYVNPAAKKVVDWNSQYGVRRQIDYNAQRLARTMVSHAYQEAFVAATINNPFIEAYKWVTSGLHNVCALCIEREEDDAWGLGPGIFPKEALPLDHPNGMCTFEVVTSYDENTVADAINDWYFDEGDMELNNKIDKFINSLQ